MMPGGSTLVTESEFLLCPSDDSCVQSVVADTEKPCI